MFRALNGQPSGSCTLLMSRCSAAGSQPTDSTVLCCGNLPVPPHAPQGLCAPLVPLGAKATTVVSSLPEKLRFSFFLNPDTTLLPIHEFLHSNTGVDRLPHQGGVPLPDDLPKLPLLPELPSRLPNIVLKAGRLAKIIPHRCSKMVQTAGFVSAKV